VDLVNQRIFATTQNAAIKRDWQFVTLSIAAPQKVATQYLQHIADPIFFGDLSNLFAHAWVTDKFCCFVKHVFFFVFEQVPTIQRLVVFVQGWNLSRYNCV
jgi:hypothetical protein